MSLVVVFIFGLLPISGYLALSSTSPLLPDGTLWLVGVYGIATVGATKLLYEALARGPVTVVAPIVAAYPAFVVIFALVLGRDPAPLQLAATTVVLAGAVVTARFAELGTESALTPKVLVFAVAASLSYSGLVIAGQAAVPLAGAAPTALWGRVVALIVMVAVVIARHHKSPTDGAPTPIYLLAGVQGLLDGGGHLLLFVGSHGPHPEIAAVAGSCFGAVTALLAWLVLRERVVLAQWGGMALVFSGVAALAAMV